MGGKEVDGAMWPDDLPVLERRAVRTVVLDLDARVLLFHTRDVDHPDLGQWWELPGGGIDAGETYAAAAIRELLDYEREDYFGFRWWHRQEIVDSDERF
jgi:hypothetical protein